MGGLTCIGPLLAAVFCLGIQVTNGAILTPPYFNLAEGKKIYASATCGVDTEGPELYCKLVGANAESDAKGQGQVIQGQVCDYCDPTRPDQMHPPEFAVDGMETWWQSPPLSRGMKYNEVNLTIDLGQEFHVAYVYVRMGNSPRPGLWVLEKSSDYGKTYTPWQYFSDSPADCETYFGKESLQPITRDDSVICSTEHSKIVPLEGGEIPISLLNNRPSANMYFNSTVLQEWTRATNVRFRLLRTKNLLGHLMSVARQDPTVTRRYFYSIKDISIGGRCMCNGHADTCDHQDPENPQNPSKLVCRCQHNTCGPQCATCCPGFEQKAWRISKAYQIFQCEPCNCFNHTTECKYNVTVDEQHLSLDIHGKYEGGGVCQNCQHNTEGINCNKCKSKFYRPFNKEWNEIDVCKPCDCDHFYSTGNCLEGTGQCECRPEFTSPNCDSCNYGYFGYPDCRPCECNLNGTDGYYCEAFGGQCPCKSNYDGIYCNKCAARFYNFPECLACECNSLGSLSDKCNQETGNCTCKNNFRGRTCSECEHGYYSYPDCHYSSCDTHGTIPEICDKESGKCLCKPGYGGPRCDQCLPGYYGYPDCKPCNCSEVGSATSVCDATGKCPCLPNFASRTCDQCSPGYFKYPECLACNCDSNGAIGVSCDNEGICQCKHNFDNNHCSSCKEGFYNFPICEECNCNPAGVTASFQGCGFVPAGELCECKDRVTGRICDTCRPLFWNLQIGNPDGCEPCRCNANGVVGNVAVCETTSGQCVCKAHVGERDCNECKDGSYDLQGDDVFGCKACDCDIGGSVSGICDKKTGQCTCQSRINGRTCREPLQTHFFPTLYQFQYEVEDGHTPSYTLVRYGYKQNEFPNYSWKGYAIFSPVLQNEIIQEVYVQKPSIYRMVLSYVNPNLETVVGMIKITPDNPSDIEQKFEVIFKPTNEPMFVTVANTQGAASPFVMNPGRWAVSINIKKNLYLDYFVLLPAAFYEATILSRKVETPCTVNNTDLCRHYTYPSLQHFDFVNGDGGYVSIKENRDSLTEYLKNTPQLKELNENNVPLLTNKQSSIHLDLTLTKPGPHVLIINYLTPQDDLRSHNISVLTSSQNERFSGSAILPKCDYTSMCRQVVVDNQKRINIFNFDTNFISIILKSDEDANVGIKSVVAIPYEEWSLDFIRPKPVCVRKDGKCVKSEFPSPPDSKKVRFEQENEKQVAVNKPPHIFDNTTNLIYLDDDDSMIDIRSKVPHPGQYVFVVHYFQPNHPEFDMDVIIQNGQFYEAKLPVKHCPSNSGCREIIRQADSNTHFTLNENFVLTLKNPKGKTIWLDNLLVIPAELYSPSLLIEENFDQTGEFISTCGSNHFYIDESTEGFCREAVFSLTTDYNNGALPCHCDYDGSLSFECDEFGGQCQCKPNVIGRKCEACKTGFYGFPDCKPCDCPSTAYCETNTGQCICPPRVTGDKCDQCKPFTYGFDQLIGCEDCNCNPLGVARDLQCDLFNGSCACKPHVVGRTCDSCEAGYFSFPYCDRCQCEESGTTLDICDKQTAECHCKQYAEGQSCEQCKEGTFNLQKSNEEGCTKCFCFGKTSRCISSNWFWSEIGGMDDWMLYSIIEGNNNITVIPLTSEVERLNSSVILADLTVEEAKDQVVYFSGPERYIGNHLTSYGGKLNYTIFYTTHDTGSAVPGADLILFGSGMFLLHDALEQPAAKLNYAASIEIVETNFVLENGMPASREHLMTVLENLEGVYIRATYWESAVTTRLGEVTLDSAIPTYHPGLAQALSIEMCQCPPNYWGLSCEECAPGFYRVSSGPHGGFCVPCQCNGHAEECDVETGVCRDCRHNTRGDHCELCDEGYHGNALQGTPMDCLICACPLPIPSNNFATGCDVSPDGESISCDCKPGYYGARCQSCAAGFYGQPEKQGEICKPCECSGNINPEDQSSCDSVSGECLNCLNNTFGAACALCAPGYFGDAVKRKNCQSCLCDLIGTERCDSYEGTCQCLPNVVGEKCDRCEEEHYGFSSGEGCKACECQIASESTQCDDTTGQCRCKRGVTGRTCDHCAPGFWNYSSEGCLSCGCNTDYSRGFGCNAQTGQCECLQGVIGEKCDHCPYRWVLIENEGCFGCDSCTHDLLDVTDALKNMTDPVILEFESVASEYFTSRKLIYINNTANELKPAVDLLDPMQANILSPLFFELEQIEQELKTLHRKSNYSIDNSENIIPEATKLREDAIDMLSSIRETGLKADDTLQEVQSLSFDDSEGPKIDQAIVEANQIINEIRDYDFTDREEEAILKLDKAQELLKEMKYFNLPVKDQWDEYDQLKQGIAHINDKLNDIANYTKYTFDKIAEAEELNEKYRGDIVKGKLDSITDHADKSEQNLKDGHKFITKASEDLAIAHRAVNKLRDSGDILNLLCIDFNNTITGDEDEIFALEEELNKASNHSEHLSHEAQKFDHQLTDTRNISESALDAANAYKKIVNATKDAKNASEEALKMANQVNNLLEGLEDKSFEAQSESKQLLQDSQITYQSKEELEQKLKESAKLIEDVKKVSSQNDAEMKKVIDLINRLGEKNHEEPSEHAIHISDLGKKQSKEALDRISTIANNTKDDLEQANQLPKNIDDTKRNLNQAHTQLDKINTILPNITDLIDSLGPQQTELQDSIDDIENKIKQLERKIHDARKTANKINVGLTFYPNTTLELRNLENLADLSTATHISTYFSTNKSNGLVFYLGNKEGTKLKRTKSDDYMALEIENGYPVLKLDTGNGLQRVINKKSVEDGKWYQVVIDRTGPVVILKIREEINGKFIEHVEEAVVDGPNTIFNLDKDKSKLFVGGYPPSFDMQKSIKSSSFEGQMEEFVVGDTPIGFWNFVDGEENYKGAEQRDKLLELEPSMGYRFNGKGFAILDAKPHPLHTQTDIRLEFKTSAPEGLLFLVGKDSSFMSLELQDGKVLYQYDLGYGTTTIATYDNFNDGKWHTLQVTRDRGEGRLYMDNQQVASKTAVNGTAVSVTDKMYFGGYPGRHNFTAVTNRDFDGCIDNVTILGTTVILSINLKVVGAYPGCKDKFFTSVSFEKPGYIRHPNISSSNDFKATLKFRTQEPNGLIFYATDPSQTSGISLSLINGSVALISQRIELITSSQTKYNDNEWHVVSITHDKEELRLNVDDWEEQVTDSAPPTLNIMYGEMFVAGLPENYKPAKGTVKSKSAFRGCLADTTVNGAVINFAAPTDKKGLILGRCILEDDEPIDDTDVDIHEVKPIWRPPPPVLTTVRYEEETDKPPSRGDGGFDGQVPDKEEETTLSPTTTTTEVPTTTTPVTTTTEKTTKATLPPTIDSCALPMVSQDDVSFGQAGYRLGTSANSRLEFDQHRGRYKNKYDFALEFKTTSPNGTIFYVTDQSQENNKSHYVALIIIGGKVRYLFNCGSGAAILESDQSFDDGKWHKVEFNRNQNIGKLLIDGKLSAEGRSEGESKQLSITPPYYIGGVPKELANTSGISNIHTSFVGCVRGIHMNGKPMENPRMENIIPCSDNVENGVYFPANARGFVRLQDRFKVGTEIDIQLDIKPRNTSGIIMSVHGKRDYLVIQMVDGVIRFTVDNGLGAIEAAFKPPSTHFFCDGNWHSIQAIKSKNVVSLSVDKTFAEAGIGGKSYSTDTRGSLFLGGHQYMRRMRGFHTRTYFVGCIRNVVVNDIPQQILPSMAQPNIQVGVCPTN